MRRAARSGASSRVEALLLSAAELTSSTAFGRTAARTASHPSDLQEQSEQLRRDEQDAHRLLSELKSQLSAKVARVEQLYHAAERLGLNWQTLGVQQQLEAEQIGKRGCYYKMRWMQWPAPSSNSNSCKPNMGNYAASLNSCVSRRSRITTPASTALRISTLTSQQRL